MGIEWDPEGENHPLSDSLSVIAVLNDSVFSLTELAPWLALRGIVITPELQGRGLFAAYDSAYKPLMSIFVENISTDAFLLGNKNKYVIPCRPEDRDWEIVFLLGKEGFPAFNSPPIFGRMVRNHSDRDYFRTLEANEQILYEDSINITEGDCLDTISKGKYWIVVKVQNYWFRKSSQPIWTGESWSDTVWFTITE